MVLLDLGTAIRSQMRKWSAIHCPFYSLTCWKTLGYYHNGFYFHFLAQEESSSSQTRNDQNVIYFKEINVDPNAAEMGNTTRSRPSPLQKPEVQSEPSGNVGLESGLEPDSSYSSPSPETQQSEEVQPSYGIVNTIKQESQGVSNERLNTQEDGATNKMLGPSEPEERKPQSGLSYDGTQSRPFYPESDMETKTRLEATQSSGVKEEKAATLEEFVQQPMRDEPVPSKIKIHEPPAGLTYVPPVAPKPPPKKPVRVPLIKLPPALALITPKRGINDCWFSLFLSFLADVKMYICAKKHLKATSRGYKK